MSNSYERKLNDTLCTASGREKGFLIANNCADGNVYGKAPLTRLEMHNIKDSIQPSEAKEYNRVINNGEALFEYLLGIQLRYLTVRERLAVVGGLFSIFSQNVHFGELLNDLSWGKSKAKRELRKDILSHRVWFGSLSLSEADSYESIQIGVADSVKEAAFTHINAVKAQAIELKTKITIARNFMDEKDTHLKAYEEYLAGIEGELSDLIHNVKGRLYRLDGAGCEQLRDVLAETGDKLYILMEALSDYEALAIDEALYNKECAELMSN